MQAIRSDQVLWPVERRSQFMYFVDYTVVMGTADPSALLYA